MCGIAGFWSAETGADATSALAKLRRMNDVLYHRGPDGEGYWQEPERGIGLAQRRLAIQDLSPAGAQPMASESARYIIVYNGEIYNHLELREKLAGMGAAAHWRGHSDTETLLAAIEHWGVEQALGQLQGMFAFALWDNRERSLILARDRMGEKPLYYGWSNGDFLFGSELKALRAYPNVNPEIDREAVSAYLRFSYVPAPHTIYRDMRKLPPGSFLRLTAHEPDARPEPRPYWSLKTVVEAGAGSRLDLTFAEASTSLEALLGDVVQSQMISDVPLGAFLSGGIDSSLITALMQARAGGQVHSFSIGFDDAQFNEAEHARAVAKHLGTEHTEFLVTEADALDLIAQLPQIFDEPFADSSQLPTILLSRLTRKSVTVALSGDGGDEVFGGYNRHLFGPAIWNRAGRLPDSARKGVGLAAAAAQRLGTSSGKGALAALTAKLGLPVTTVDRLSKFGGAIGRARDFNGFYRELVSTFPEPGEIARAAGEAPSVLDNANALPALSDPAERMMALDALSYLPDDILVKVDRSAMSASLETRAPFLDARIVEHAARLPMPMKIKDRQGKRIIRDILYRHVPRDLIERPKQGFAVPMDAWLRGRLRDWGESLLTPEKLEATGLLRPDKVAQLWRDHQSGRDNAGARLWTILMLQAWYEAAYC